MDARAAFDRQRRNVVLISAFLIFKEYADLSISKLSLLGNEIKVGAENNFENIIWIVWLYFVYRFVICVVYEVRSSGSKVVRHWFLNQFSWLYAQLYILNQSMFSKDARKTLIFSEIEKSAAHTSSKKSISEIANYRTRLGISKVFRNLESRAYKLVVREVVYYRYTNQEFDEHSCTFENRCSLNWVYFLLLMPVALLVGILRALFFNFGFSEYVTPFLLVIGAIAFKIIP